MMLQPSVVVVGSINEDVVMELGRPVRPGETVRAERIRRFAGGKGANQAVAAASAGAAVAMVGAVGDDDAGARMLADLRDSGVRTDSVRVAAGTATGTAYITVTPDGENSIILDRGANWLVDRDALQAASPVLTSAKVLVSLLEIPVDTVIAAVQLALGAGVRPVVTLAPAQPVPPELLRGLDPVLVNQHEAAVVLGVPDIDGDAQTAARQILTLGPSSVVVTLGASGAVVADGDGVRFAPAAAAERVVDTTGAGDAFAGALAAALAGGAGLDAAVAAGQRAGAAAVGRPGAR
jgi:ribokinase